jgi:filamentous hemagglutinin family protein
MVTRHSKYVRAMLHTTAFVAALCAQTMPSYAEPTGGVVSAGSANISNAGSTTTIKQHSDRAIIRWDSFDINSSEQVKFQQPSTSSITVNRIRDNKPSQIDGRISANGNIVLINPNGMVFGSSSVVDVGGLVATTSDLDDDNAFMNGGAVKFTKPGKIDAKIINNGTMTARDGGLIGLVAPHVENNNIIQARLGKIQLASGDIHTIDFAGDGLIKLEISENVYAQSVKNTGTITADGGSILLTAATAREIVETLVTNTGTIRANSVTLANKTQRTGSITLTTHGLNTSLPLNIDITERATATKIVNTGSIRTNGDFLDQIGGNILLLADAITLGDGSIIEAAGDAGGGTIGVGGDYQGGNGVPTSDLLYISNQVILNANARRRGPGGKIILWSDENTLFYGHAEAAGGIEGGDGGLIEVSSKGFLDFSGTVNLHGRRNGTLLLDPTNITISTGSNTAVNGSSPFMPNTDDATSVLNISTLQAALASGNVIVQTRATGSQLGTITIANSLAWNSGNTLTLDAHNAIIVNASVAAGSGSITMIAGGDVSLNANVTGSGTFTIQQANDSLTMGVANGSGTLNLNTTDLTRIVDGWSNVVLGRSSSTVSLTVGAQTWSDNITLLSGSGGVTISGAQTMGANNMTVTTTNGAVSIGGMNGTTGGLSVSSGGGAISIVTAISTGGAVSFTSGGGVIYNSAAIGAGSFTMTSGGGNITIGSGISASGVVNINAGSGTLAINAGLSSSSNALTLSTAGSNISTNASGILTGGVTNIATSGGNFTTLAGITTSGTTTISTGAGLINVGSSLNTGSGALSLITTGNTVTTASLTSGALTITTNGAAISTGAIMTTGNVTLTSGSATISTGSIASASNTVNLTSTGFSLSTGAITSGALTLSSSGGAITTGGTVAASGTTNILSGGGSVNFNAAFSAGALTITTSGGSLTTSSTLTSAAFTVTSGGADILIGGAITATGSGTITSGSGTVQINGATNMGNNLLSITTTAKTITTGNITSGALTLSSSGAIISTGTITASGTTSINAGSAAINVGATNTGSYSLSLTTAGASITTASITSGALSVGSGGGGITFNGAVAATGTANILSGGGAINVNAALGSGTSGMTITTSGGAFTKANTGSIASAALSITTGNGNINIGTGGITATGNVTLGSGTGSIAVGGSLSATGTLGVTASKNTITLGTITAGITTIASGGAAVNIGATTAAATTITTTGGSFTLGGNSTFTGNLSVSTGVGSVTLIGSITTTSATTTILTSGGSINKAAAINTSSGAITLTSGGGAITIGAGGITASTGAGINVSSGAGVINVNSAMNSGTGNMTITTDADLALNATNALSGTGTLTIVQATANKSIVIGTGTGDITITAAEQAMIRDGWGNIVFGRTDGSAAMNVSAMVWTDSLTLRTGSGIITLGAQTFGNNAFTILTDADITFTGTISGGTGNFNIQANNNATTFGIGTGQAGTIAISDTELTFLTNNWNNIYLGSNTLTGAINVGVATWNDTVNIRTNTGVISINGVQTLGSNNMHLTSNVNVILNANITGTGTTSISALSGSSTTMAVGDGQTGSVIVTNADMAKILTTSITFGNSGMNGAMNVAAMTSASHITYSTGNGLITINGTQTLNSNRNLTIISNVTPTLNANLVGMSGGSITFYSASGGVSMGIGDGQAGTISLNDSRLARIVDGWGSIIFGSSFQTGAINVAAKTWTDSIQFRASSGALNINGDQNLGSNNLNIMTDTTANLNGNLIGTGILTIRAMNNFATMAVGEGQAGTIQINNDYMSHFGWTWGSYVFGHTSLTTGIINVGAMTWNKSVTFASNTAAININGLQQMGSNNLTFTTNGDPNIAAGLSGSGTLTFQISSTGTNTNIIGIGDSQAGTLLLSNSDLGNVLNGWNQIIFGNTSQTGAMNIGAYTWQYDTVFRTGSGVITISGEQITERNMTFETNSDMVINAALTGTGVLTFRQAAVSVSMGLAGATGSLNLNVADLNNITDGWSLLVFGRNDTNSGTGVININGYTWKDNVKFISGAGIMTIAGNQIMGTNNLTIDANSNLALNASLTGTANLIIEGAVASATMGIGVATGTIQLTAAELNQITDGWASLTFGSITGTGAITMGAYTWKDNMTAITNGNITVSGLQTATTGTSLTYATLAGSFSNTTGSATPITAGTGARYLIYSVKASSDSYGSFVPPSPALTQKSYFNYAPGSVVETGNRILYSDGSAKILYLKIDDKTKVYGDTLPTFTYTYLGGLQGGDTIGAAITSYTLSATGAGISDSVGVNRAITGSFTTGLGYTVQVTDGTLSVTKAPILVTTGNYNQYYGDVYAGQGVNYIGLRNGETSAVIDTLATATSSTDNTTGVGTYIINISGAADDNYTFNYATGTLNINPAIITVTTNSTSRDYGSSNPALTYTYAGFKNGQNQNVFTSQAVASTTATTSSNAGDYAITASGASAANYTFNYSNTGILTVNKVGLTITTQNAARIYGDVDPIFTVNYSGFRNGDTASVVSGLSLGAGVTGTSNVGTYTISGSGASAANYNITYVNSGLLTINKATLTATTQNAAREYGLSNPTLSVVYTGFKNGEDDTYIDTVANVTTAATSASNVGNYAVSASGAADTNYNFNYANTGILSVTKATLTATTQNATREYGSANPALSVIYTGFRNTDTQGVIDTLVNVSTSAVAFSNVGSYAINASGGLDNNYQFVYANTGVLDVTKATLNVTSQNTTREYGLSNPAMTLTYSGFKNGEDVSVIDALANATTTATTASNVGTYTISGTGGTDNNYQFNFINSGNLSITKATLTGTTQNVNREYGLANTGLSIVYTGFRNSDDETVIDTQANLSSTASMTSNAGTSFAVTATGASDNNYNFFYANTGVLTVTKATLTATTQNATREYGLSNPTFSIVYTGFRNGQNQSVIDTLATATSTAVNTSGVGVYSISGSGAADNNYDFVYSDAGLLSVTKATLMATTQNATREYGLSNPTFLIIYTGFRNSDTQSDIDTLATAATSADIASNVGNYGISSSGAFDDNYQFIYANTGNLSVTKATLTATTQNATREYGMASPAFSIVYTGFRNGDDDSVINALANATSGTNLLSNVGIYNISASGASDNNYQFIYANTGQLEITKAMLTATSQNATREYGLDNPNFTFVYTGFRNGQNQSVIDTLAIGSSAANATSGVGTYGISGSGATDNNYDFTYADTGTLAIGKATLTVTTQNATREYGLGNPVLDAVYTGFRNGDTESSLSALASVSTLADLLSNAGSYAITASGAMADNYQFNYINSGNLSITKATVIVTTQDATREYGLSNTGLLNAVYSGFRNGDTDADINVKANVTSVNAAANTGSYAVSASGASDNNYQFSYTNTGQLTITKATLNVTAHNKTRETDDPNPVFTAGYSGFRNGDNTGDIDTLASFSTPAHTGSPVGIYAINVSGAIDNNYDFVYTPSMLTIIADAEAPPVVNTPTVPSTVIKSISNPIVINYAPLPYMYQHDLEYKKSSNIVFVSDDYLFTQNSNDYLIAILESLRDEYRIQSTNNIGN